MNEYILEVQNLTKVFPGVRALDNVSFKVKKGEIHCLCGENGAGKSTLMKVVSGVHPHDSFNGKVSFNGKETNYKTVKDSENDNMAIIHQELALSPYLTIFENIFLGHIKTKHGIINWNKLIIDSRQYLKKVGLNENPETIVSKMGVGKQQLVEIARALSKNVELLILDEPTSSLNDNESEKLLLLINELKNEGITCIMISHKLNEVMEIADSITILRDGQTINSYDVKKDNVSEELIIKQMVGRDMTHRFPDQTHDVGTINVLEVKDWSVFHPEYPDLEVVRNASFHLKQGEILAFCGPMGAGRTELMMSLFGKAYGSRSTGQVFVHGREEHFHTPKDAIAKGMGYVSEDRKDLGLILIQSVKNNISNSSLKKLSYMGIINKGKETLEAENYKKSLNIKTPTVNQIVNNLSGGNQQKVVLSRCLLADPDIFIVDEPTRGIDVGAKYEIYSILKDLVKEGKSVIIVTSEMPEAIGMADRIYVMNEGLIKGELSRAEASQEKIMTMALKKIEEN
ncbi:MAG: sugar ABC transporter ATP-binding protein [Spirochaetaceae bacterium]|nr:sugar ABC transporter ATP-binding protein [Spirochaetaceae bacterium]